MTFRSSFATFGQRPARALALACSMICAAPAALAAAPDGQLWYTAQQFLSANSTNDNQVGRINADQSSQTIVTVSPDSAKYYLSVGLDTAAGLYFAIHENFNAVTSLVVGNINTGAVIQELNINPADYAIEALAVNPKNHKVYIGVWGDSTTDTGIVQISYDPVTGAIPTNIFTGTVISPSFYLTTEAAGSPETFANSMAIDVANQKLYISDEDINLGTGTTWGTPYSNTNGIYVLDLNQTTPIAQQLTTTGQFPATNAGYHTAMESVAVDVTRGLIYFETTNLTNGASPNITLWWLPIGGGTATAMTLPGNVILDSSYYGTIALDPNTHTLYLSSNGNSTTTPITPGFIYSLPLSGDGHSFVSASQFAQVNSADPNLETDSLFFESIPKLTLVGTVTPVVEQGAAVNVLASGSASDPDGVSLVSAKVQITGGTFSSNENSTSDDHLSVPVNGANKVLVDGGATTTNITATYTAGTETLALNGVDTIVNYNKALALVQFASTGDNPTNYGANTTRTLSWTVSDGTPSIPAGSPNSGTTTITISAVNDAPAITAGNTISYTELAAAVAIAPALTVSDPDNLNLNGGTVTISAGNFSGDVLNFIAQNGIVGTFAGGVLTLTGAATIANYQTALRSITFASSSHDPSNGGSNPSRTISFVASDGSASGTAATSTININAINDAPVNTVPGAQAVTGNTNLPIGGFAVSDIDGGSGGETSTLTVAHGTLTVAAVGGATVGGSGTASVTINGTLAQINATLSAANNIVYRSTAGFAGTDTLTFVSNDNGHTGSGGALSDSDTVSISVIGPPTLTKNFGAPSVALNGSTSLTFTVSNANAGTTLSGVGFTDNLPAGMIVATPNGLTGSCGGGTISATAGGGAVSLNAASLAASATCSFSINVTGIAAGTLNNTTSTISSNEGGSGTAASATLVVVAAPSISAAFLPNSIANGATTSLMFTILNQGNTVALNGVAFADTLPTGLTVGNAAASVCGGTLTTTAPTGIALTGATIAVGGQCQFSVTVTGSASGQYTNTTSAVTSTNGGTGNTASANLTVGSPPSIAKSFGAPTIPLNGSTSLIFNITNPNASLTLTGIAFTDTMPSGLIVAAGAPTNTCGGTLSATAGSGSITLSNATLASGASCAVSLTVTGNSAGAKVNSVSIASTEGGTGNTSTATLTVVAPPTLTKNFGAPSIPFGGTTSLSFTVTNPNTGTTLNGIAFTDTLPAGLSVASPSGLVGSCLGTISASSGLVSVSGATLAANTNCSFSVNVVGTAVGTQNNVTSTIASTEGGSGTTATASIDVVAMPVLTAQFSPAAIALNATTSLQFTIANPAGNPQTLNGVSFTDTLPSGLTVASAVATVCGGTLTTTAPGSIALSGATIASGAQCQFAVTVTGAASGQYSNTSAAVTSTNGGVGNTATANLSVAASATIGVQFGAPTIPLNGSTSLSFTIANANTTQSLSGIAFTDTLPAGLAVTTPNGLTGSCGVGTITAAQGSSSITLAGATLAASGNCTFSINVTGTAVGDQADSVTVTSTEGGTGNTATAHVVVVAAPTISTAFGAPSIPLDGTTSASFTLSNSNAATALSGLAFNDTLPAGLVVAAPNGLTGSCGSGTITAAQGTGTISLAGGTLAANASCTFSINVKGIAAGTQSNTTGNVSSSEGGSGTTSNTATLTVIAPPTIAKSFSPANVQPNQVTRLTFTLANPAANVDAENDVAFTDTMPTGVVVAATANVANSCGGNVTQASGSGVIALANVTLATATSCTLAIDVVATGAGQFTNVTDAVTSSNGGSGNQATAILTSLLAHLAVSIDDGRSYAQIGHVLNYIVTVTNNGPSDVSDVSISETLSPEVVTEWLCISGGGGETCTASGSGPLSDSNVSIPAGRSISWLITTPVLFDNVVQAVNTVTVSSQLDPNSPISATDTDIIGIFRDGFEAGGGMIDPPVPALVPLIAQPQPFTANTTMTLRLPAQAGSTPVDTLLDAHAADGSGFRVERLNLGTAPRLRLVGTDLAGVEHPTPWSAPVTAHQVMVGIADSGDGTIELATPDAELTLPLAGAAQRSYDVAIVPGGN